MASAMLASRLLRTLLVVLLAVFTGFTLVSLLPGDRGAHVTTSERRQVMPVPDDPRPLLVQAGAYTWGIVRGDFGVSQVQRRPVADILAEALPATGLLGAIALVFTLGLGIGLGTHAGWVPAGLSARFIGPLLLALYTLPEFVLGTLGLGVFSSWLGLLPVGGMTDLRTTFTATAIEQWFDRLRHAVLPASVLAIGWSATLFRQQQQAVATLRDSTMVRAILARGLSPRTVLYRHVLRRALPGTLALTGTWIPTLLGGAVVVETLFAWPGVGRLLVQAVALRDAPVVAGAVVISATAVAVMSLLLESMLRVLDPRLRPR